MKTQVKHRWGTAQKHAATNGRNFRTFLLVSQFEAQAIGARIALARNEQGMTQEELAGAASFSKRSLQDYEAGITIPYKHLRELGVLLDRPVEWFLRGEPDGLSSDRLQGVESQLAEALDRLRTVEALLRDGHEEPPQPHEEKGS